MHTNVIKNSKQKHTCFNMYIFFEKILGMKEYLGMHNFFQTSYNKNFMTWYSPILIIIFCMLENKFNLKHTAEVD